VNRLRIATRKSRLAMWQSQHVAELLRRHHPELAVELVPLSTRGDEVLDRSLAEIGGKGLFLKELEHAMLAGQADAAVHSLKDVPAECPSGFELAVFLERADWHDWWVNASGLSPGEMPVGASVGTSSLRRQSQLLALYPELKPVAVRGNVHTRLALLERGDVDALILAAAGLDRLGIRPPGTLPLSPPAFLPAPGQGVITVQIPADSNELKAVLEPLGCAQTTLAVRAERAVVAALGGDCRMPLAALAEVTGDRLSLRARLASPDGRQVVDASGEGATADPERLGRQVAERMLDGGGMCILSQI